MTREIVLDTETTGLSPKDGHRVVEIGCVELDNHIPTGVVFHQYISPQRDMPTSAYEIHGLSEEFLSDKPLFSDIAGLFMEFVKDASLIIHNASFDLGFLNFELELTKATRLDNLTVIDTLALAQKKHPAGPNSLDALCRRYGVDNSGRTKHGALLDAELLAEVYLELIGGAQPNLSLIEKSDGQVKAQKSAARHARPDPLPSRLNEDDRKAHAALVEGLGEDAVWNRYSPFK